MFKPTTICTRVDYTDHCTAEIVDSINENITPTQIPFPVTRKVDSYN
jgi:hypothetical protein